MSKVLHPVDGGCWFCHKEIKEEEVSAFSGEFDTNLHINCLEEAVKKDPNNPEARTVIKELNK